MLERYVGDKNIIVFASHPENLGQSFEKAYVMFTVINGEAASHRFISEFEKQLIESALIEQKYIHFEMN